MPVGGQGGLQFGTTGAGFDLDPGGQKLGQRPVQPPDRVHHQAQHDQAAGQHQHQMHAQRRPALDNEKGGGQPDHAGDNGQAHQGPVQGQRQAVVQGNQPQRCGPRRQQEARGRLHGENQQAGRQVAESKGLIQAAAVENKCQQHGAAQAIGGDAQ